MSNKILPVHILRLYAWEALKNNTTMIEINGLVPIIPIEDEPKLADSGKTYLIYGFSEYLGTGINQIRRGNISFRIVAINFTELGEISNVLSRVFENEDESAANINAWSSNYPGGKLNGITFTYTNVTYVSGSEPADQEGGPIGGLVNIEYRYKTYQATRIYDANSNTWT